MDGADNGNEKGKEQAVLGMKETYDKVYKTLDYGPIATARGLSAAGHIVLLWHPCKVLCIGAGNAYEAVYLAKRGFDVTVIDYVKAPVKTALFKYVQATGVTLPFKNGEFNLAVCCECIEHIPPNEIDVFMSEIKRVATFFYFTVDDEDDPPYHTHVLLKTPEWWIKKFSEWGITGKMFKPAMYREKAGDMTANKTYRNNHGFNFYGNKVLPKPI